MRVDARGDLHLPPPAARRLHLRRRRGGGALPRRPRRHPPLPLARCCRRCPARRTATTCSTTPGSAPSSAARTGSVALAGTARQHGLGLVVDVVPNHMALVAPESANAPLVGRAARTAATAAHAHWFDVDWDALDGRIGLPVLWEPLADVLAKGDLRLGEEDGGPGAALPRPRVPGRRRAPGTATADADVAAVLDRQHYRLAGWRERDDVLNYRRFFDVDALIAVRVEEPDVFEATHRVLLDLNHRGIVEGFRIDHPDGLADPEGYLERLRAALRPGTAIWVEKILEGDETLPDVGLRRHHRVRRRQGGVRRPRRPRRRTGPAAGLGRPPAASRRWSTSIVASKRQVVADVLVPERRRLVRRARRGAARRRPGPARGGGRRAAGGLRGLPRLRPARAARSTTWPASRLRGAPGTRRRGPPGPEGRARAARRARDRPPDDEAGRRLRRPAPADLGPGDGQGHRGHRVLPLAPPGRPQRGRRRPRPARRRVAPTCCTAGRCTSSSTGRSA